MIVLSRTHEEKEAQDGSSYDDYRLEVVVTEFARLLTRKLDVTFAGVDNLTKLVSGTPIAPAWLFFLSVRERPVAYLHWVGNLATVVNGAWVPCWPYDVEVKQAAGVRTFEIDYDYDLTTGALKFTDAGWSEARPTAADKQMARQILRQELPWRGPEARGNPRRGRRTR